ncbi:MAG: hypothetical protein D6796_00155, partial [Caldilineae bacterium]
MTDPTLHSPTLHYPLSNSPLYKRTEVGVIPEEWEVVQFGEVVSIRNQKVLPKEVDADTICIELEHIGQGNGRITGYSTSETSTSTKYRFYKGDVLFGRLRAYLKKYWYATFNGICTTEIWPLTPQSEQIDNLFLFYIVQTRSFVDAASVVYGTHMPRTDWGVIGNLPIPLPPLAEQRAHAGVLPDVDPW